MSTLKLIDLVSVSDIMPRIATLHTDAARQQQEIHLLACSSLDHIRQHGDSTAMVALHNALPNGTRVKALALWAGAFSNAKIQMKLDKATGEWTCKLAKRTDADFDMEGAMEISFADYSTERDYTTLNIKAFIKGLARTASNTAKFDGTDQLKVDPAVNALAAKLNNFIRDNGLDKPEVAAASVAPAAPAKPVDQLLAHQGVTAEALTSEISALFATAA